MTPAAKADTRTRILDAARSLIAQTHPAALSVAEIARAAGVSHRTVYRHFSTKEQLIGAVAEHPTSAVPPFSERYAELPGALRMTWRFFADHLDDLRGERMVPGGIELRRARLEGARRIGRVILRDAGVEETSYVEGLLEILVHLTSSSTLLELMDRHGHDVDTAVDIVLDAVDRLVRSARSV